jgi:hypothetical protein
MPAKLVPRTWHEQIQHTHRLEVLHESSLLFPADFYRLTRVSSRADVSLY